MSETRASGVCSILDCAQTKDYLVFRYLSILTDNRFPSQGKPYCSIEDSFWLEKMIVVYVNPKRQIKQDSLCC